MSGSAPSRRVPLFDELRGLSILLVVLYHAAYDLVVLFGVEIPLFYSPVLTGFLQPFFAGVFVMISGAACHYSRSNPRRGAAALGFGLLLTLVTTAVMPAAPDRFGVLHLLGVCMLLHDPLRPLLARLPPYAGLWGFFALFLFTFRVPEGLLGFPPLAVRLPAALYGAGFLFPLGLPNAGFVSADYFPLLPWGPLFYSGVFLGALCKANRLPGRMLRSRAPWLAAVGRHTLWIYLLHQPVLLALLGLWFRPRG